MRNLMQSFLFPILFISMAAVGNAQNDPPATSNDFWLMSKSEADGYVAREFYYVHPDLVRPTQPVGVSALLKGVQTIDGNSGTPSLFDAIALRSTEGWSIERQIENPTYRWVWTTTLSDSILKEPGRTVTRYSVYSVTTGEIESQTEISDSWPADAM